MTKTRAGRFNRHGGTPVDFVPPRDRTVRARDIPCPICGVDAGALCVSPTTGNPVGTNHRARRRMAIRARYPNTTPKDPA